MTKQNRTITIALLVADRPVDPVVEKRGDYVQIYNDWLRTALKSVIRHDWQDTYELQILPFEVKSEQKYPSEAMLSDGLIDAIMITGSTGSAHADEPWINKLVSFVEHVVDDHPLVRVCGICFGHQIVARALGGTCTLNDKGWEVGVYENELTKEGRELLMYPEQEKYMRIQEVHRDIVLECPDDCYNLATTAITPCQGLARTYPTPAPPLPSVAGTSAYMAFDVNDFQTDSSGPLPVRSVQILSVQGHPEFDTQIVRTLIDARTEMGVITGDLREDAIARHDKKQDGNHIGQVFLAMLGVEPARTDVDVV